MYGLRHSCWAISSQALTAGQIAERLGLGSRAVPDFLDGLVALQHLVERDGVRGSWAACWRLPTAGCTRRGAADPSLATQRLPGRTDFGSLFSDPARLEQFVLAMTATSIGNFHALTEQFDFSRYQTVCDVGGADGQLSIVLARRHPHLRCTSFDLPMVTPIAARAIDEAGLSGRVTAMAGDFFADRLPTADVITMSLVLHDWGVEQRRQLIRAAYEALPAGGVFINISHMIDAERRQNVFALMISLSLMLDHGQGSEYTPAEFRAWCTEVGFKSVEVLPLAGPSSAGIAYK